MVSSSYNVYVDSVTLLAGACTASVGAADVTQLPDDVMLTSSNISFLLIVFKCARSRKNGRRVELGESV